MIQVFQYPHETLLQTSTEWNHSDTIEGYNDIEKFEKDYIKLMLDENGMGLAANQVGITKRFFAMGHETFDTFQKHAIIWNPRLISQSEEQVVDVDVSCISQSPFSISLSSCPSDHPECPSISLKGAFLTFFRFFRMSWRLVIEIDFDRGTESRLE